MAGTVLHEDNNDNTENNKRVGEDEKGGGNGDEPRKTTQSPTDTLRLQDAISGAIKLREAGNEAFRAGNYGLSINLYEDAAYKIVYLKGLQQLGAIPSDDQDFAKTVAEMKFKLHSNEAASWLKCESYLPENGEVSRFQKALNRTDRSLDALKEYPTAWKPSDEAMARLLYRRALAFDGLRDYDAASIELEKANLYAPADKMICALQTKIKSLRKSEDD